MSEAVEDEDRSIKELMEGMKEGARDIVEGNTLKDDSAIRERIERLREDL